MNYFLNLSTRAKLSVGFGIGLISLLIVIITSIAIMKSLGASQQKIESIYLNNVIDYMTFEKNISANRIALLRMMRTRDRSIQNVLQTDMSKTAKENDEIMERLYVRVRLDPIPPEKLKELDTARKEFNKLRDEVIIPMIRKGNDRELEKAFEIGTDLSQKVKSLCAELSKLSSDYARDAVKNSITQVRNAVFVLIGIGVLVLVLSIIMIMYLDKTIAVPLRQITVVASKITEGDIETELLPENREDEVGMLCQSFNRMADSLRELSKVSEQIAEGDLTVSMKPRSKKDVLAYAVSVMAENIRGLVIEINQGIKDLEESTAESVSATLDVYKDMGETPASRKLQVATQRIEELGKRLRMIVSQIKV